MPTKSKSALCSHSSVVASSQRILSLMLMAITGLSCAQQSALPTNEAGQQLANSGGQSPA